MTPGAPPIVGEGNQRGGRCGAVLSGNATRPQLKETAPVLDVKAVQHAKAAAKKTEKVDSSSSRGGSCSLAAIRSALGAVDTKQKVPPDWKKKITPTSRLQRELARAAESTNYLKKQAQGESAWTEKQQRKRRTWAQYGAEVLGARHSDGGTSASTRGHFTVLLTLACYLAGVGATTFAVLCGARLLMSREWARCACINIVNDYARVEWKAFTDTCGNKTLAWFADNYGQ